MLTSWMYSVGGFVLFVVVMGYLLITAPLVLKVQVSRGWGAGMLLFSLVAVVGLVITMGLLWLILRGVSNA